MRADSTTRRLKDSMTRRPSRLRTACQPTPYTPGWLRYASPDAITTRVIVSCRSGANRDAIPELGRGAGDLPAGTGRRGAASGGVESGHDAARRGTHDVPRDAAAPGIRGARHVAHAGAAEHADHRRARRALRPVHRRNRDGDPAQPLRRGEG